MQRFDPAVIVMVVIGAVLLLSFSRGLIQGFRRKPGTAGAPPRKSVASILASGPQPGSPMYERNEGVRPPLERHGLHFKYWFYRAEDGSAWWTRQIRELGGPFRLLATGLHAVYQGTRGCDLVTVGLLSRGDIDAPEEAVAAIFALSGRRLPPFMLEPRPRLALGAGSDALSLPSCPVLERTHRFRGEEAAAGILARCELGVVADEPGWALEAVESSLLILRSSRSRFLAVDEITDFVEKGLRIAESIRRQAAEFIPPQRGEKHVDPRAQELPPDCRIAVRPLRDGGEEFRITIGKTFGATFWSVGLLAVLAAVSLAFIHFDRPLGAGPFILFGLLLAFTTLDYLVGVSVIEVNRQGVRAARKWLGLGRSRSYAAADIESIDLVPAGADRRTFGFALKLSRGGPETMAHYIGEREHAEIAVAKMRWDLGR